MGNNKQFNNILDECLEHLLTGNETVEQCLQRYPEYAAELEPLLRTAVRMNKAVDVTPSPDFRTRARAQLQSTMAKSKSPKRAPIFAPRWAMAVCAVLLVFFLGGSVVLAADGSMPGNPLYPVKLLTEDLSIKFAGSEERKAELYLAFADRRVNELDYLAANGKSKDMEQVAQRLNTDYTMLNQLSIVNGTGETVTSFAPSSMLGTSRDNTTPQLTLTTTTATTKQSVPSTTETFNVAVAPTITVIVPIQSEPVPTVSTESNSKLRNLIEYYALTHPEKIQELLNSDKVPESVKLILRRALLTAQNDYQNALNNLSK